MADPTSQNHKSTILYCPKEIKMHSVKGGFRWHTVHIKIVKTGLLVQYFTCTHHGGLICLFSFLKLWGSKVS